MISFFIFVSFVFSASHKYDDLVKNISSYTDLNMLLAVQLLTPKADSKEFVDRPTNKSLKEVKRNFLKIEKDLGFKRTSTNSPVIKKMEAFAYNIKLLVDPVVITGRKLTLKSIQETNKNKVLILKKFLHENFLEVGTDLHFHEPVDFVTSPSFLSRINNKKIKKVAKALNYKWKELSRAKTVFSKNEESTLLDLPHPFMIPGGRFREYYYWDTFWIAEGLLVCEMHKSVENIIKNFIHTIKTLGYIPNGLRKYYLFRSQQPYFPQMLLKLYNYKNGMYNELVLGEGLDMAIKEMNFFLNYRSVEVTGASGKIRKLSRFHVTTDFPRPESFREDVVTAKKQSKLNDYAVWSNLKAGAESGWDFSSRWLHDETDLTTIAASAQIPADLNAVIFRNLKIIEKLLIDKKNFARARVYTELAKQREEAINDVLWNSKEGVWMDFNLEANKHVNHRFYFSNVEPLIYGIRPVVGTPYQILEKYQHQLFGYPGGIPASGDGPDTHQQWDFPNVWAPHNHMIVDYLLSIGEREMALHIARNFFRSVYLGYENDNEFYEKYLCNQPGVTGAGGEYAPQTGFGWTNGTALSFINEFGDELLSEESFGQSYKKVTALLKQRNVIAEAETSPFEVSKISVTPPASFKSVIVIE